MKKVNVQVGEYLDYCEKVRGMSETTLAQKRNVLFRFVVVTEIMELEEITNEVFNEWVKHETERGVSAWSVNAYNAVVLAMVRYYRGIGVNIPLNMALVLKLKEGNLRRNFYTREDIMKVIEVADFQMGLMIRVMFETGMRIAEVTRLKLSDFDGRCVRFVGKGNKPREVYISHGTLRMIEEYIVRFGVKEYLWGVYDGHVTLDGRPPTINTIRKRLKEIFARAGFSDFYPHAIRHSFATDLQLKGASVEEIKEMIGHSSIATTERYLHGFEGRLKELFDKYQ